MSRIRQLCRCFLSMNIRQVYANYARVFLWNLDIFYVRVCHLRMFTLKSSGELMLNAQKIQLHGILCSILIQKTTKFVEYEFATWTWFEVIFDLNVNKMVKIIAVEVNDYDNIGGNGAWGEARIAHMCFCARAMSHNTHLELNWFSFWWRLILICTSYQLNYDASILDSST